jgi:hypothetical protein
MDRAAMAAALGGDQADGIRKLKVEQGPTGLLVKV